MSTSFVSDIKSLPIKNNWHSIMKELHQDKDIGILIANKDGKVVYFNQACTLLCNGDIELYTLVNDLFSDKLWDENLCDNAGAVESENEYTLSEMKDLGKKVKVKRIPFVVEGINEHHLFSGPMILYLISDYSEISGLQQECNHLRLLYKQLEEIFDASFDEIYVTDENGKTIRVSKSAYERIYGRGTNNVIGKNVKELQSMGRFWPSVFPRILEEKRPITFIQYTSQNRKNLVTSTPIFDDNNNIIMVVSNSRDITELLNLRERLEHAEDMMQKYEEELSLLRSEQMRIDGVIAESSKMKNVIYAAAKAAKVDSTILISGQTGVGKDVVAKTIHKMSPRSENTFIKLNCAAIPESLLEAELFGYESGAFTGAAKGGKRGLIELSEGGTLFLDEIGEIPLTLQAKFLDLLQDKHFMRVGGSKRLKLNTRIVAATNRDLADMVEKGQFRQDLYYRLMVIPIEIPPLKERPEDILPLVKKFLENYNNSTGKDKAFSPEALDALCMYEWPGNVREVEHTIERLLVMSNPSIINLEMLPKQIQEAYHKSGSPTTFCDNCSGNLNSSDALSTEKTSAASKEIRLNGVKDQAEEQVLREAAQVFSSTRKIAKMLGISQSSVVRKLKKYNIKVINNET